MIRLSAKIWDTVSQAFVERQNVPKRYDAGSGAFVDTTGRAFDHDAEAWVEKWSPVKQLYLYNEGNECTDVTGGWHLQYSSAYVGTSYGKLTKNADNMCLLVNNANYYVSVTTGYAVDATKYNILILEGKFDFGTNYNGSGARIRVCVSDLQQNSNVGIYGEDIFCEMTIKDTTLNQIIVNVSSLVEAKYLYLTGACGPLNLTFKKIWLE